MHGQHHDGEGRLAKRAIEHGSSLLAMVFIALIERASDGSVAPRLDGGPAAYDGEAQESGDGDQVAGHGGTTCHQRAPPARELLASSLSTWRATRSARYLSSCGLSKVVHHLDDAIAHISLKLVSQELAALRAPTLVRPARSNDLMLFIQPMGWRPFPFPRTFRSNRSLEREFWRRICLDNRVSIDTCVAPKANQRSNPIFQPFRYRTDSIGWAGGYEQCRAHTGYIR